MTNDQGTGDRDEYYLATRYLDEFGIMLERLLLTILKQRNIHIHEITFRVKARRSATEKVQNSPEKYTAFRDLTDLLGVRVITYFPDQVDQVAKIITREFDIDEDRSVDKRIFLDPDRFGYLSLHYIARLNSARARLPEHEVFASIQFELQIRSILQHAWAEIEHDLGYKSRMAVPREVRRRFYRLAGLLEIADDEFLAIRRGLERYEKNIGNEIRVSPGSVSIDRISIREFIIQNKLVQRLDTSIARIYDGNLEPEGDMATSYANRLVSILSVLGVTEIQEVVQLLSENEKAVVAFATQWAQRSDGSGATPKIFPHGVSLYYLSYIIAFKAAEEKYRSWRRAVGLREDTIAEMRETFAALKL
jgi:ppGpp synthetase/RelA/SpoT-type nucleotidyltranferase